MFDNVNLKDALERERQVLIERGESHVLDRFKGLFEADWEQEKRLRKTLKAGATSAFLPNATDLDESRIFDLASIKNLCVRYRLRFLSTKQFKGEIPTKAFRSIRETEAKIGHNLEGFMIIAPSKMFQLEDVNKDPLLFAPLEDGRYYLIDKWGNDLAWYRRITAWPAQSPATLLLAITALSLILAALLPISWLSPESGSYFNLMRLLAFGWNLIFLMGVGSYLWFSSYAKFSVSAWNSKHFN